MKTTLEIFINKLVNQYGKICIENKSNEEEKIKDKELLVVKKMLEVLIDALITTNTELEKQRKSNAV